MGPVGMGGIGRRRSGRAPNIRKIGAVFGLLSALVGLGVGSGGEAQNLPDLQITSPFTVQPGEIEQGGIVSLRAVVTNNETGAVPASFDVKFQVLREDTGELRDLTAEEVLCVNSPKEGDPSRCVVPPLAPVGEAGDSFEVRAQLDTSNLSPASYILKAIADPENVVQERRENNNEGEGFLIVLPRKPNLSVLAEFRLQPEEPRQGDLLSVEFVVENDRQAGIAAPIPISLGIRSRADVEMGRTEFRELIPPAIRCPGLSVIPNAQGLPRCALGDGLPGNTRRTVLIQVATAFIEPGAYQMRIFVDPDNDIDTEADEEDNILTFDFELLAPPRNLALAQGRVRPPSPVRGQTVFVSFLLRNESSVPTEGVDLEFVVRELATGAERSARELPGFTCGPAPPAGNAGQGEDRCRGLRLEAGDVLDMFVEFSTEGLELGSYELRIAVDPQNRIVEERGGGEEDNELRLSFTVVEIPPPAEAGPELHPISLLLTPNSPILPGEKVLLRATIENSGTQDAGAFRVEFALRREDPKAEAEGEFRTFSAQTLPRLRLGHTVEVQALLDTGALRLEEGIYALRVRVIALDDPEIDPNNNDLIVFFSITAPPES